MSLRTISYGGGVQSTALCVLATQGKLGRITAALYANVGDDSEHPATNDYVKNVMTPWAAERGLTVHTLQKTMIRGERGGETVTLMQAITRPGSMSMKIPVYLTNGTPASRSCTSEFKIGVVGRWLREHGANADNPADVMIGISVDEIHRASNKKINVYENPIYPLLDLGLNRGDCEQVIREAGLPVPHKSSCFFCPFHRPQVWAEMRRDEPELFDKAQALEDHMNARQARTGSDPVYLTRFNKRLTEAIATAQDTLPFDGVFNQGSCDEGYCWT